MEQDKILSGSWGNFFRDLGRSMHYFMKQGHTDPLDASLLANLSLK